MSDGKGWYNFRTEAWQDEGPKDGADGPEAYDFIPQDGYAQNLYNMARQAKLTPLEAAYNVLKETSISVVRHWGGS